MRLSLIYAVAQNGAIGYKNDLPWPREMLREDLKRFREITMGFPIIMGRKTHESIGRPLDGRDNVVISRQPGFMAPGCLIATSLDHALEIVQGEDEAFVIGGAELFKLALPLAERIYRTYIHADFLADTFFSPADGKSNPYRGKKWELVEQHWLKATDTRPEITFTVEERINAE